MKYASVILTKMWGPSGSMVTRAFLAVKGRHGWAANMLAPVLSPEAAPNWPNRHNMMVLHQLVVVLVGLLASFTSGEETTIASTSAEPFWLGKDCVRNEDG